MFWFIVLLLFVGGGFYIYQKLMAIEREIRLEQEAEQQQMSLSQAAEPDPLSGGQTVRPETSADLEPSEHMPSTSVAGGIMAAVASKPGIRQTELYMHIKEIDKKRLQQTLKEMADRGQIRREKKGSSYLLYPM